MPLISLPVETVTQIFFLLDECEPEKPYWAEKHREMGETLMAIRLTCKELEEIATRQLFRTFCLSPSLKSWMKLHTIAASQKLRVHLQILALERHPDLSIFNSWGEWYDCIWDFQRIMTIVSSSSRYRSVDLSQLPNLKILKAEDKWVLKKKARSNVRIPFGHCQIRAISFGTPWQQPAYWNVLGGLTQITHYDFEILSLNCKLGSSSPWKLLVNVDFTGLKYLRLFFKANFWNNPYDSPADKNLLAKLQHLPNLEEFHLDQFFHHRSDPIWLMVRSMTNVLGGLKAKDWPRLRYLDLRFLTTTVADFQAFVAPHAETLETFHLHSGLLCAQVTQEEKVQRFYLPHWIRTVLCPRGGVAKFRHFLGQPGGWFVAEGEEGDAEEADAEEGDAEEGDAEEVEDSEEEDQGGGS